jgi:hypothetical protein
MVSRTLDCEIANQHWERCPTIVCALSPRRLSEAADLMGAKDHYERTCGFAEVADRAASVFLGYGQTQEERLCTELLILEGFEVCRPSMSDGRT